MEDSERNRTSIGLHVTLKPGGLRALLLGDLDYGPVKQVFEYTQNRSDKEWDVFLAPHHCSKGVMYERENGQDVLRRDVLDLIEYAKASRGGSCRARGQSRLLTRRATTRLTPRRRRDAKRSATRSFAPESIPTSATRSR